MSAFVVIKNILTTFNFTGEKILVLIHKVFKIFYVLSPPFHFTT